jgi:hypothetical protein
MEQKTTYIYGLADPFTREVRYVGKSNNPEDRLLNSNPKSGHLAEAKSGVRGYKNNWLRGVLSKNGTPLLLHLETCKESEWQDTERKWIKLLREKGYPLTNTADGGDGGWAGVTPEMRKENSKKLQLWWTPERRCKALLGNKNGCGGKGKKCSEETKRKMSLIAIERWKSAEEREKASGAKKLEWASYTEDKKERILNGSSKSREIIKKKFSKPVLCIDTGEIFESVRDAARHLNYGDGNLRTNIKHNRKSRGLTFKYL